MKSHPLRIQRKRVKGWRMPYGATCVTRPGKFGNPHATAVEFRLALDSIDRGEIGDGSPEWQKMLWIHSNVKQLRGFKLACWCSLDADCHADELAIRANI